MMLSSVFLKSLRDRRIALLWWAIGVTGFVILMAGFWPFVENQRQQLEQVLESLPPQMFALLGLAHGEDVFSPEGYLTSRTFGWVVPIIFSLYAASQGAAAIAGEEEDNTIDLLMANPLSRVRVLVEKWLAMAAIIVLIGLILGGALVLGDRLFGLGIDPLRYAAAAGSAVLLAILIGSLALALGAAGLSRAAAMGVSAAVTVTSFLINSLGTAVPQLEGWRLATPFYYYDDAKPLLNGLDPIHAGVLAGGALLVTVIGAALFSRRDLGT